MAKARQCIKCRTPIRGRNDRDFHYCWPCWKAVSTGVQKRREDLAKRVGHVTALRRDVEATSPHRPGE